MRLLFVCSSPWSTYLETNCQNNVSNANSSFKFCFKIIYFSYLTTNDHKFWCILFFNKMEISISQTSSDFAFIINTSTSCSKKCNKAFSFDVESAIHLLLLWWKVRVTHRTICIEHTKAHHRIKDTESRFHYK